MSTDIERELRQLGDAMSRTSTPITGDEVTRRGTPSDLSPIGRVNGLPVERGRRHHPASRERPNRPWLAVAVVAIVVAGIAAVWAVARNDTATPPVPADQPTGPVSTAATSDSDEAPASELPSGPVDEGGGPSGVAVPEPSEGSSAQPLVEPIQIALEEGERPAVLWDEVKLAPGTVGWYDVNNADLPDELAVRLGGQIYWDLPYLMGSFRCPNWDAGAGSVVDGTIDAAGVTCDGLQGGYREFVEFGANLSVGTGFGRSDWTNNEVPTIETLLFGLADGSLWGYETHDTPPEPTRHDIDGVEAVSYRVGDHAYLVLEPTPGTFVWLNGRGLSDPELESVAEALEPEYLVATVPVPLVLGPDSPGGTVDGSAQLQLVWIDGVPCVSFDLSIECTPADSGPALVVAGRDGRGQQPSVAAIVPAGDDYRLTVALFGIDEWQTVPRTFIGLGLATYVYRPSDERLFSARLADPDGDEIAAASWGIDSMINGFAPDLVAEGRTDDIAWVVVRQGPAWDGAPPSSGYRDGYCLVLFEAGGGSSPLCPPTDPPAGGLGVEADYHDELNLIEVGPDVTSLDCGDTPLDIITDDHLDNRRFVVSTCDEPAP